MARGETFRDVWTGDLHPTALLTDTQIRTAIETHGLLIDRTAYYDPTAVKYASYEVHAAPEVGRVDFLDDGELEEKVRSQTKEIVIAPGDTVRLFTAEHLLLPADVFCTVTGLGQLYAAGLTVGSTYVDPGTSYRIYLSVSNVSEREVIVPAGAPIGRAQFFVLGEPAATLKRTAWRTDLGYKKGKDLQNGNSFGEVAARLAALETAHADLLSKLECMAQPARLDDLEISSLRRTQRLHEILIIVLGALLTVALVPASVWETLSGGSLPPLAKFAIPALAGGLLFFLVTLFLRKVFGYFRGGNANAGNL